MSTESKPQVPVTHPLELELATLLNSHSAENESNTPDYILAQFMFTCLSAYNNAIKARQKHSQ